MEAVEDGANKNATGELTFISSRSRFTVRIEAAIKLKTSLLFVSPMTTKTSRKYGPICCSAELKGCQIKMFQF